MAGTPRRGVQTAQRAVPTYRARYPAASSTDNRSAKFDSYANATRKRRIRPTAANAGFIRNQTRARSQRAGPGWKRSCESLDQDWSWQWVPQQRRRSLVRGSVSRANGEKYCRPSLPQESLRLFILRLFFGSRTRSRANANTSILYRIFALHYAQLAKNKTKGTEWRFPESSRGMSQRVNFFCVP